MQALLSLARGGQRRTGGPVLDATLTEVILIVLFLLVLFVGSVLGRYGETVSASERLVEESAQLQAQLAALQRQLEALLAGRDEAERERREALSALEAGRAGLEQALAALAAERREHEDAEAVAVAAGEQLELADARIAALRRRVEELNALLRSLGRDLEVTAAENEDLRQRLSAAEARELEELRRYRSEFFGRLREALGDRDDIREVGDRFVFQSEVLFPSGSADLQPSGRETLSRFADTLLALSDDLPAEIDWVLRVDGHTDSRPISTPRFPSNWELSTARATAVVRFLIARGIPPDRLAAAGFGEYVPLDDSETEAAWQLNRRIELRLDQRTSSE